MTEDFYDLLDVSPDASQDEIKTAFREQVRVYHPDLNDDERARAQFTALKTAYDVLGDPVERRAYDRLGHVDYVAKRTSGLPSPEKWSTSDDDADDEARSDVTTETGSWGTGAGSDASGGATATGSAYGGGTNAGSGRTQHSSRGPVSGPSGVIAEPLAPLVRWWRSLNVAGPLLWAATVLYFLGLARYGRAHADAVDSLWGSLRGAGGDIDAITTTLTSGTHGLDRAIVHVQSTQIVSPPVARPVWIAALGCLFGAVCVLLVAWRYRTRNRLRGPVTIDETIVLAVTLGGISVLSSGPLLAGALLLPLLYGVVIYHSRQLSGWSPSYAYLVAVSMPTVTLLAGWLELTTLPVELLAIGVLPLVGAIGLPLRFAVRRHFGI